MEQFRQGQAICLICWFQIFAADIFILCIVQCSRERSSFTHSRCHGLSLPMNRVCTGQSSDSERASAEWQSAVLTPQFIVSFSLVSRVSKHLIECIAIES